MHHWHWSQFLITGSKTKQRSTPKWPTPAVKICRRLAAVWQNAGRQWTNGANAWQCSRARRNIGWRSTLKINSFISIRHVYFLGQKISKKTISSIWITQALVPMVLFFWCAPPYHQCYRLRRCIGQVTPKIQYFFIRNAIFGVKVSRTCSIFLWKQSHRQSLSHLWQWWSKAGRLHWKCSLIFLAVMPYWKTCRPPRVLEMTSRACR